MKDEDEQKPMQMQAPQQPPVQYVQPQAPQQPPQYVAPSAPPVAPQGDQKNIF